MYIPLPFQLKNFHEIKAYIHQYPFATLITTANNQPLATHLPFILEQEADQWYLLGHMAKANPQWQLLLQQTPLVIFQGPHAYISPRFYEKEENVPTWNYVAVHVYGQVELLLEEAQAIAVLEKTITTFEKEYQTQWQNLDIKYKQRLLGGMVAFKIKIQQVEAKEKLSQNKSIHEQQTISSGLLESNDSSAQQLGNIMKNKL